MFSLLASEAYTSRGNDGSSVTPLSSGRIGVFIPSIRDASGGAPLLGISICPRPGEENYTTWRKLRGSSPASIFRSQVSVPRSSPPLSLSEVFFLCSVCFRAPSHSCWRATCSLHTGPPTMKRSLQSFSDPGKFYVADPYTFLFASLMVLIFGTGFFAVDTLVAKRLKAVE